MPDSLLLPLIAFTFTMSVTPGPNNVMLTASGVNFGFRRTVPHMVGISTGVVIMVLAIGMGLGTVFQTWPQVHIVMKYLGAAYLLYLAWRIAVAGGPAGAAAGARPMSLLGAAAFQWVNPKAWMMVVGAVAAFAPAQDYYHHVARIALVMAVVGLPTIALWAGAGTLLRGLLQNPHAMRSFNIVMALLLVASLYPALNG
ncbi:LysE family translocator [Achromobacter sp. GG226]|uniref:LysE family translocator n=1 Tax=Verticiella alkaliphila TaxID=2779529 RepID=UPI00209B63E1|nr:LysE family translocator [Verticiella sp. GG226]MBU4611218.1 LysE family translocator [Verticiella sp. GG226]